MMESGVRFVELIDVGSSKNWMLHSDIKDTRAAGEEYRSADIPAAGRFEIARDDEGYAGWCSRRSAPEGETGRGQYNRAFSS